MSCEIKNGDQVRHLERKFTSVFNANKQLMGQNAELCKRHHAQAEQLQHKDRFLQQVVADHQGLQYRFKQLEMRLLQHDNTQAPDASVNILPARENASLERIAALEAKVDEQVQLLRFAHERNVGFATALAKDKIEAEFYAEKVHELTGRLEGEHASDTEKDRLLEYKDKMYEDLDIRCSENIEALQARVQRLEKEAEFDKASSDEEIVALKSELERKTRANLDLEARKNAFKSVNKSVFDVRKLPNDDTRVSGPMYEICQLVHVENSRLTEISEAREKDLYKAKGEIAWLRTTMRNFRTNKDEKTKTISTLEEQNRAQACELERLKAEVDILPAQHDQALADKDVWISHYKQKAEMSNQEKNTFINTRLDPWVRCSFQSKDREISCLENEVGELRFASLQLRHELQTMADVRAQDAAYAYVDGEESRLNKDRTKAAEEEVQTLRKELSDLLAHHNPIRNKEDKDIEEVLMESEELQDAHAKSEAESRDESKSLHARLEQGTIWAYAVKDLGVQLLARISKLENTLQDHQIQDNDGQRDALIHRYQSLLDFVDDEEAETEGEADAQGQPQTPAPTSLAEQMLVDFDEILAQSNLENLRGDMAEEAAPTVCEVECRSAVAGNKFPDTPNTRAQRIIAEKERALGTTFDSYHRVVSRTITTPRQTEVEDSRTPSQEEGDSFDMTSSAWARKYSPKDEAEPSNAIDESFFR